MRVFLEQNVDVAIFEVGLGGRLDATNCIRCPVVCGISALGFDHMDVLGHTLPVRSIQYNMQASPASLSVCALNYTEHVGT